MERIVGLRPWTTHPSAALRRTGVHLRRVPDPQHRVRQRAVRRGQATRCRVLLMDDFVGEAWDHLAARTDGLLLARS